MKIKWARYSALHTHSTTWKPNSKSRLAAPQVPLTSMQRYRGVYIKIHKDPSHKYACKSMCISWDQTISVESLTVAFLLEGWDDFVYASCSMSMHVEGLGRVEGKSLPTSEAWGDVVMSFEGRLGDDTWGIDPGSILDRISQYYKDRSLLVDP